MVLYIKLSVYVTRKNASGVEKRRNVGLATNSTFFFYVFDTLLGHFIIHLHDNKRRMLFYCAFRVNYNALTTLSLSFKFLFIMM